MFSRQFSDEVPAKRLARTVVRGMVQFWGVASVGLTVGNIVGRRVGLGVGRSVGSCVGAGEGFAVGLGDGGKTGCAVGTKIGDKVGLRFRQYLHLIVRKQSKRKNNSNISQGGRYLKFYSPCTRTHSKSRACTNICTLENTAATASMPLLSSQIQGYSRQVAVVRKGASGAKPLVAVLLRCTFVVGRHDHAAKGASVEALGGEGRGNKRGRRRRQSGRVVRNRDVDGGEVNHGAVGCFQEGICAKEREGVRREQEKKRKNPFKKWAKQVKKAETTARNSQEISQ